MVKSPKVRSPAGIFATAHSPGLKVSSTQETMDFGRTTPERSNKDEKWVIV